MYIAGSTVCCNSTSDCRNHIGCIAGFGHTSLAEMAKEKKVRYASTLSCRICSFNRAEPSECYRPISVVCEEFLQHQSLPCTFQTPGAIWEDTLLKAMALGQIGVLEFALIESRSAGLTQENPNLVRDAETK